jgi:dTDP-4-dehydrorhamnose 3,5-epimerase
MASEPMAGPDRRLVARGGELELHLPTCDRGIGAVISSPQAEQLIEGVRIHSAALWPDDRGYFLEVQRFGQGPAAAFGAASTQVSAALSYPGAIKAFHYHLRQQDYWTAVAGMLQVALVDMRSGSRTFGVKNTLYIGALKPWQVLVPAGVAHGYKVIGNQPSVLVYLTDRFYDPSDEGRIAYNEPHINYDWELQHK